MNARTSYGNSTCPPTLPRIRAMKRKTVTQTSNRNPELAARVGRALIRAAESARRTARMYGTPLYVWENGRVVAKRP
jgi:hypothetical protein